jgi:hypothetical protein
VFVNAIQPLQSIAVAGGVEVVDGVWLRVREHGEVWVKLHWINQL